jgi:hypothetical protein
MRPIQFLFFVGLATFVVVAACGKQQEAVNTTYLSGTWSNCVSGGGSTRTAYAIEGNVIENISQSFTSTTCTGTPSSSSTSRYDFTLGEEPIAVPSGRNIDAVLVNTTSCLGALPCAVSTTGAGNKYIGVVMIDAERKLMRINFNVTANAPESLRPQSAGSATYSKQE